MLEVGTGPQGPEDLLSKRVRDIVVGRRCRTRRTGIAMAAGFWGCDLGCLTCPAQSHVLHAKVQNICSVQITLTKHVTVSILHSSLSFNPYHNFMRIYYYPYLADEEISSEKVKSCPKLVLYCYAGNKQGKIVITILQTM